MTMRAPSPAVLDLLRSHGRNLHSFMVLEPGLSIWHDPENDAAVAYVSRGGRWIAAGGPLCAPDKTREVAVRFAAAARDEGKAAVFFGVSERFLERLDGDTTFDALLVGQAPIWDPVRFPESVRASKKLRNRLGCARRAGVIARRVDPSELSEGSLVRGEMIRIARRREEARALPEMGFMATLDLFSHMDLRRYFVVERSGEVEGFAVCVPVYGRGGWLVEDMMLSPGAAPGCGELLVEIAMRELAAEGAALVSLGMVALAGLERDDRKHPLLTSALQLCARVMGRLYNFEGLYRFRNKLKPDAWEDVYVVSSEPVSWWTIRAVLMAFAEGPLPWFALRALWRRARGARAS